MFFVAIILGVFVLVCIIGAILVGLWENFPAVLFFAALCFSIWALFEHTRVFLLSISYAALIIMAILIIRVVVIEIMDAIETRQENRRLIKKKRAEQAELEELGLSVELEKWGIKPEDWDISLVRAEHLGDLVLSNPKLAAILFERGINCANIVIGNLMAGCLHILAPVNPRLAANLYWRSLNLIWPGLESLRENALRSLDLLRTAQPELYQTLCSYGLERKLGSSSLEDIFKKSEQAIETIKNDSFHDSFSQAFSSRSRTPPKPPWLQDAELNPHHYGDESWNRARQGMSERIRRDLNRRP